MAVDTARVEKLRKKPINGQSAKRLVEAGSIWLRTNQQTVNALNVFPVPDGDTGTNMVLTMQSAWNEIKDLGIAASATWRRRIEGRVDGSAAIRGDPFAAVAGLRAASMAKFWMTRLFAHLARRVTRL